MVPLPKPTQESLMPYLLQVVVATLILIPLIAGVFLPIIPGIPTMFAIVLLFGLIDHFQHLRLFELGILAALAAGSILIDYLSGMIGARFGGASAKSLGAG